MVTYFEKTPTNLLFSAINQSLEYLLSWPKTEATERTKTKAKRRFSVRPAIVISRDTQTRSSTSQCHKPNDLHVYSSRDVIAAQTIRSLYPQSDVRQHQTIIHQLKFILFLFNIMLSFLFFNNNANCCKLGHFS